jgi:hypothetical protein
MNAALTEIEAWKPIVGFEGRYEVSNFGSVRILVPLPRSRLKPKQLITQHTTPKGYHRVSLSQETGRQAARTVHRLVLESFVGLRPPGMMCCHRDGDPHNNHHFNLRWGTQADNEADKVPLGRSNRGSRGGHAKLTEDNVHAIRRLLADGLYQRIIASIFRVSGPTIANIKAGRKWKYA